MSCNNQALLGVGKVECRNIIGKTTEIDDWIFVSVIQMRNTERLIQKAMTERLEKK